jgi:hypothetical protein
MTYVRLAELVPVIDKAYLFDEFLESWCLSNLLH